MSSDAQLAEVLRRAFFLGLLSNPKPRQKAVNYTFPSPEWDGVSAAAKSLVRKLLEYDVDDRYTTEQALAHEWITQVSTHLRAWLPRSLRD